MLSEILEEGEEIIGYFAQTESGQIFCHKERKPVIAETKDKMLDYLYEPANGEKFNIKEVCFNEILSWY